MRKQWMSALTLAAMVLVSAVVAGCSSGYDRQTACDSSGNCYGRAGAVSGPR